jgi:hypothetical protein
MNCYDCSAAGRAEPAVAVCAACGAGICLRCAQLGTQTVHHLEGFVRSEVSNIDTRVFNCPSCAGAMHAHHRTDRGLVAR